MRKWHWFVVFALIAAVSTVYVMKRNADLAREDRAAQELLDRADSEAARAAGLIEPGGGLPMLLDLGAGTCIPCRQMQPILEALREEYKGRVTVQIVDVNEHRDWVAQFRIYLIPTQIFFDGNGKELFRHEGFFSREDILGKFKSFGWEG